MGVCVYLTRLGDDHRQLFGGHFSNVNYRLWPVAACDAARDRRQTALDPLLTEMTVSFVETK
jgi:hypothetical protein